MRPVLDDGRHGWSAAQLADAVDAAGRHLGATRTRVLATVLDNGAPFVALDEAALRDGWVHVPLPQFFSAPQMRHALQAAGVDTLVAEPALRAAWPDLCWQAVEIAGQPLMQARLPAIPAPLPLTSHTFTSGSPARPSACASASQQVAHGWSKPWRRCTSSAT